ncbi:MAG: hypothetical protein KatS3mg057_0696 [Herpetosiphonaceae bacterium]|nr:MAG: hypothetical protein KatS3mg057_0696 [Herpetosiphonaceae bacterium]
MEQPLGYAVGNALEVKEAISTLRDHGPADLRELCLILGSQLVLLAGQAGDEAQARARLEQALSEGRAWAKFRQMVEHQGGDTAFVDDPERLPRAPVAEPLRAAQDGYVTYIDALTLGLATVELGGGRQRKGDPIDHSVGIVLEAKVGDQVSAGQPLLTIHAQSQEAAAAVRERLTAAVSVSPERAQPLPLIFDVIR